MIQRSIKRSLPAVLGLTIAAVVLAGCSAPGEASKSSGADASGPIKIAVVDAQSGQLSSLGAWELKGVTLAVDEANDDGGIDGRKIDLTGYDDTGDPTIGTNLATKLASDGNIAMFGTAESAVVIAMAPVLASNSIPFMTSGSSPGIAALHNSFAFMNTPPSTAFDDTLADYLNGKGYKSYAMISNNGGYGVGEHDSFLAALGSTKPVADQIVTPDQKDFSAALTTIRDAKPDVLFIGAEEVESGLIVKQARELGITAVFAGGAPMATPTFVDTAGVTNAEDSVVATPYLGNDSSDAAKKFAAAYKKKFGEEAELHGAKAYDGANIMIQALKDSKVGTGKDLADAIRAVKYKGLVGDFDYDADGVGVHKTLMATIKDGKLVNLDK